jgi:serine/threonine protein kinase
MKYCPICEREYANESSVCPSDGAVLRLPGAKPDSFEGREIKGRYRILSRLGQGGMGSVYLAEQKWMRRKVALKILKQDLAQDDAHVARFRLEARLTGNLDHRNIPRVYDFDQTEDGSLFIVMELVEGHTLTTLIGECGSLGPGRALRLGCQVAEGLQAAHRKGVVHRDIKPDNIMVETGDVVKVMDFGVARLRESENTRLTQAGFMVGTPQYMAPEQIEGGEVTERTDIYSLGIVLYEMLTGEAPFKAKTPAAVIVRKLQQAPPPPSAVRGDIPAAIEALVLQMMEADPARRPGDISEVVLRLRTLVDEGGLRRAEPGSPSSALDPTVAILAPMPGSALPGEPISRADPTVAPVTPTGTSAALAAPIEANPARAQVPPPPITPPAGSLPLPSERAAHGRKGEDPEAGAHREVDGGAVLGPSRDASVPPLPLAWTRSRRMPAMVIVVVLAAGLGVGIWWLVSGHEPEVVVKSVVVPAPSPPEVAPRDAAPPSLAGTGPASGQKEDAVPLAGSESVVSGSSGSPPPAAQQGPKLVEGDNNPAGPEVTPPRLLVPSSRVTEGRKKEAKQESSRVTGKAGESRPESVPPAPAAAAKDNVATQEPSRPSPGSIKVEVERRLSQAGLGQLLVQVDDQLNVVLMGVTETSEDKTRAISLARAVSGAAEVRPRINVRLP